MTNDTDWVRDMQAGMDAEEGQGLDRIADAVVKYYQLKRKIKEHEQEQEPLRTAIENWMHQHGDEPMDVESVYGTVVARYESGGQSNIYEPLVLIAKQDPSLFKALLSQGCLMVNDAVVKKIAPNGSLSTIDKWRHKGDRTRRFVVDVKSG